jgi:hypothetical protein
MEDNLSWNVIIKLLEVRHDFSSFAWGENLVNNTCFLVRFFALKLRLPFWKFRPLRVNNPVTDEARTSKQKLKLFPKQET